VFNLAGYIYSVDNRNEVVIIRKELLNGRKVIVKTLKWS